MLKFLPVDQNSIAAMRVEGYITVLFQYTSTGQKSTFSLSIAGFAWWYNSLNLLKIVCRWFLLIPCWSPFHYTKTRSMMRVGGYIIILFQYAPSWMPSFCGLRAGLLLGILEFAWHSMLTNDDIWTMCHYTKNLELWQGFYVLFQYIPWRLIAYLVGWELDCPTI